MQIKTYQKYPIYIIMTYIYIISIYFYPRPSSTIAIITFNSEELKEIIKNSAGISAQNNSS